MATLMLASGEHPKVVSERMGHSPVAFTLATYGHVIPGMHETAAQRLANVLDRVSMTSTWLYTTMMCSQRPAFSLSPTWSIRSFEETSAQC
jgi:hypothetical protein